MSYSRASIFAGIGLMTLATLCFAILDTSAKSAMASVPVLMALSMRYLLQAVVSTAVLLLLAFEMTSAFLQLACEKTSAILPQACEMPSALLQPLAFEMTSAFLLLACEMTSAILLLPGLRQLFLFVLSFSGFSSLSNNFWEFRSNSSEHLRS